MKDERNYIVLEISVKKLSLSPRGIHHCIDNQLREKPIEVIRKHLDFRKKEVRQPCRIHAAHHAPTESVEHPFQSFPGLVAV